MSKIRACRGCGEIVALAFENPYERFERMFFEEAEKSGFFKMFSVENGMIKLAGAADQYTAQEIIARERNLDKILNRIDSEDLRTQMSSQQSILLRKKIISEMLELARQKRPALEIHNILTQILENNQYDLKQNTWVC
jgi:hypothetical protein